MYKRWLNITTIYCKLSIYKIKQNHSEIDLLIFVSEYNQKCYKQSFSFGLLFVPVQAFQYIKYYRNKLVSCPPKFGSCVTPFKVWLQLTKFSGNSVVLKHVVQYNYISFLKRKRHFRNTLMDIIQGSPNIIFCCGTTQ